MTDSAVFHDSVSDDYRDSVGALDVASQAYVDAAITGLDWKAACRLATAAALSANTYSNGASGVGATLTGVGFGALTIDGSVVVVGDRVLVKNEVAGANNGIYVVTTVGAIATLYVLTRAADYNQSTEIVAGDACYVVAGTANLDTAWVMTTTGVVTVGTTVLVYAQFGGSAPFATPAIVLGTAATAGAASTVIRSDSTIVAFDATVPSTQAFGDAAATGSAAVAARRDHKHAMPADPTVLTTPAADTTTFGVTRSYTAGENLAFGDPVYIKSDGKAWKADANGAATYPAVGVASATIASAAAGLILLHGIARNDAWAWTVGGLVYLSTSAGLTQIQPAATDDAIQILGVAETATRVYVNPQLTYITHT